MSAVNPLDADARSSPSIGQRSSVTLVDGRSFAISDVGGDMVGGVCGLVHADNRFLSQLTVGITGQRVEPLSTVTVDPFHAVWVSRIHGADPESGEQPEALLIRRRTLDTGLREVLELRNLSAKAAQWTVVVTIAVDFAHIFDVKAGLTLPAHQFAPDSRGLVAHDGGDLSVSVTYSPPAGTSNAVSGEMSWHLRVDARSSAFIELTFEPVIGRKGRGLPPSQPAFASESIPVHRLASWEATIPNLVSEDPRLAQVFAQSLEDIASLRIFDNAHPDRVVVAAGAPWFMTLFGRDSLLTAHMCLPFAPELAVGVLGALAELQGRVDDPATEEQPGRILHELRRRGGEGPFAASSRYYGTVDATALFVMLAAEAYRWGALSRVELVELIPALDAAMTWIITDGDSDQDGFVDYDRRSEHGLTNQGWKDSWDGITFANGALPDPPIALAEVQGYAYAAHLGAAELYGAVGRHDDARRARQRATDLRERFNDRFWNDERGWFVLGLDGAGRQIDALATNAGHALWTGIADPEYAARYVEHLAGPAMFTGWGLRTLSENMAAYDPLAYHNGSVWPHDTALCVAGMARYGHTKHAHRVADGLLDAATHCGFRLPELFSGLSRDDVPAPVPYPSSCSPQAWASASVLLLLRALTGLDADVPNGKLFITDRPSELPNLRLFRLRVDAHRVDLTVSGGVVDINGPGHLEVTRRTER
jgi:glycogen debranching enzyme